MWVKSKTKKIGTVYEANSQIRSRKGTKIQIIGAERKEYDNGMFHRRFVCKNLKTQVEFSISPAALKSAWHVISSPDVVEREYCDLKPKKSNKVGRHFISRTGKEILIVAAYSFYSPSSDTRRTVYDVSDVVAGVCSDKARKTSLSFHGTRLAEVGTPDAVLILNLAKSVYLRPLISKSRLGDFRKSAKKRKIKFDLTIEYINALLADWIVVHGGLLCKFSNVVLTAQKFTGDTKATLSLDRIDSALGYIPGNIQPVHKAVNTMKQDMTDEEFIDWTHIISSNNK